MEETLEPLDPDRRAFRLVGGVLVSIFRSHNLLAAIARANIKVTNRDLFFCFLRVGGAYRERGIAISQGESSKCKELP